MAHSTKAKATAKRKKDFPLFIHQSGGGRWCKKVRQRFVYFGKVADDPKGEKALQLWADQKDDLLAGRTPRTKTDGLTVHDLCNNFMLAKEQQRDAGDITPRSYDDYHATGKMILDAFGKKRLVTDLASDDFQAFRASLAKRYGVHRLSKVIQHVRTIFKFGYEAGLIDRPVRFGPTFKKPAARLMRAHRQKNGKRMFEADQLRAIIDATDQPIRAMVMLGINAAFGNHDVGTLPKSAIDLAGGMLVFARSKTAIERRCPLWPETVVALQNAIEQRPKPKEPADETLVFLTAHGQPWARDNDPSAVTKEFRKLLDRPCCGGVWCHTRQGQRKGQRWHGKA